MFKAWLRGTHHHCTHLQKYIDEFCYRFNRLKYQDTLFHKLIERMVFTQPSFLSKISMLLNALFFFPLHKF
ncbi:transposase [Mucilaginibacter sp. 5C4]